MKRQDEKLPVFIHTRIVRETLVSLQPNVALVVYLCRGKKIEVDSNFNG